ncbi:DUF2537 domain-containing protein [Nakamurella aerolata]|uniref:DUF2537 domain-containing protein n=1 Tax=Nakamurella aerolata TaxID=1656892 RepID=A0A849A487_9ACTN|nr:DUF2537 domain-containing protein [Nakamurella aerolata]
MTDRSTPASWPETPLSVVPDLPAAPSDHDGSGGDGGDHRRREWRWVEQSRREQAPTPWGQGLVLAAFIGIIVALAIVVLSSGLSNRGQGWLAVIVNLVIAAGMAPALWLSRGIPVLRFLAGGAGVGILIGWFMVLAG